MEQENDAPDGTAKEPPSRLVSEQRGQAKPLLDKSTDGVTLNFHAPEFNQPDELNDWTGNYRFFQPLEGVVTADMRHQMERRTRSASNDRQAEETKSVGSPASAWLNVETQAKKAPEAIIVNSKGRTLIIGPEAGQLVACAQRLSDQHLTCTLVLAGKTLLAPPPGRSDLPSLLEAEGLSVTGGFGGFSAFLTVEGDQRNLRQEIDGQAAVFDLVLDLQPAPSYAGELLPIGYYAPGQNRADLETALAELPEMRGRFKKPQLVTFQEDLCFHGRSRKQNCRRCLEICPFGAIRTSGRKISIDPFLCQGCGGCALVCPAEAFRLNELSQEALQKRLQSSLENRPATSAFPTVYCIADTQTPDRPKFPCADEDAGEQRIYFEVEQIAQIGLEIPLTALACGAGKVWVVGGSENSSGIKKAVEWQMQMARTILEGLGLSKDKIRIASGLPESSGPGKTSLKPVGRDGQGDIIQGMPAATFPVAEKRRMARLAAQHLYNQSGATQPGLPLAPGSPFGAVTVDGGSCTLCLACVAACPSGALSNGGKEPQLMFQESLCHQCGLCQETCPEGAIQLHPRLLCDLEAVETPVILHQAEPFRCIKCGLAFAAPALIHRLQEKLRSHWMYAEERQLRRLRMCATCRTRDALNSEDLSLWNQH